MREHGGRDAVSTGDAPAGAVPPASSRTGRAMAQQAFTSREVGEILRKLAGASLNYSTPAQIARMLRDAAWAYEPRDDARPPG